MQVLPENPCLTRSDFQESCRLTLSNIPKRALGCLECARIAFIWPGNGVCSLQGINRVKTQNSGIYALVGF